jgi:hypothetical protein
MCLLSKLFPGLERHFGHGESTNILIPIQCERASAQYPGFTLPPGRSGTGRNRLEKPHSRISILNVTNRTAVSLGGNEKSNPPCLTHPLQSAKLQEVTSRQKNRFGNAPSAAIYSSRATCGTPTGASGSPILLRARTPWCVRCSTAVMARGLGSLADPGRWLNSAKGGAGAVAACSRRPPSARAARRVV